MLFTRVLLSGVAAGSLLRRLLDCCLRGGVIAVWKKSAAAHTIGTSR